MANDWVEKHLQEQAAQQQHEQGEQIKAQHALSGALRVFQRLDVQIQKDLATFHRGGGDFALQHQPYTERKFRVRKATYPSVTLEVDLNSTTIHYAIIKKFDETSGYDQYDGSLRIWSDLAGNVQMYRNGTPFVDESEVSQLLLEPVLTYIGTK